MAGVIVHDKRFVNYTYAINVFHNEHDCRAGATKLIFRSFIFWLLLRFQFMFETTSMG
jgi:hypothetical protein